MPAVPHVCVVDFSPNGGTGHGQVGPLNPRVASWSGGSSCSCPVVQLIAEAQVWSRWMAWQLVLRKWVVGASPTTPESWSLRLEGSRSPGQPFPAQKSLRPRHTCPAGVVWLTSPTGDHQGTATVAAPASPLSLTPRHTDSHTRSLLRPFDGQQPWLQSSPTPEPTEIGLV